MRVIAVAILFTAGATDLGIGYDSERALNKYVSGR